MTGQLVNQTPPDIGTRRNGQPYDQALMMKTIGFLLFLARGADLPGVNLASRKITADTDIEPDSPK